MDSFFVHKTAYKSLKTCAVATSKIDLFSAIFVIIGTFLQRQVGSIY